MAYAGSLDSVYSSFCNGYIIKSDVIKISYKFFKLD